MKKNLFNLFALSALFAFSATVFTSCEDDEDGERPYNSADKRVYILNEGSYEKNDSKLDVYYPNTEPTKYVNMLFANANGEQIGDTGQDLIEYNGRLYLSVNGSKYLAKLDLDGKIIEKYSFTEEDGAPRQIVADGAYVYVSLYSGTVGRFDTASIAQGPKFVVVGNNPEGMAIKDKQLLVCNSGWGADNRLSVVDLETFTLNRNITLENNLQSIAVVEDSVYVTYFDQYYTIHTLNVDLTNDTYRPTNTATKFATYGSTLYCANSATTYDENFIPTVVTNFFKRDVKTGVVNNSIIEEKYAQEFAKSDVYLFDIDPFTGDIYIGISDHITNGILYRFDVVGNFIEKHETSGINPNHAVFVR